MSYTAVSSFGAMPRMQPQPQRSALRYVFFVYEAPKERRLSGHIYNFTSRSEALSKARQLMATLPLDSIINVGAWWLDSRGRIQIRRPSEFICSIVRTMGGWVTAGSKGQSCPLLLHQRAAAQPPTVRSTRFRMPR